MARERDPTVLLSHRFPTENAGGLDALEAEIRERLPGIDLARAADHADAAAKIPDAEVVIEHRIADDLLAAADDLEWLQSLSSGYDRFDLDGPEGRGVALTTVAGVHAKPAAEHVLGYMLSFARGFGRAREQGRRGEWRRFAPDELAGGTVGIVGVGAIGGRVAELASALDMTAIGTKRDPSTAPDAVDDVYGPDGLHAVLGRADYVVLACPLTPETEGLIDARAFDSMGVDAVLINVARGGVVDQGALVGALGAGEIGGAALDVAAEEPLPPDSPLWGMRDVLITPHMAGGSPGFAGRVAELFAGNYRRFVAGDRDAMEDRVV